MEIRHHLGTSMIFVLEQQQVEKVQKRATRLVHDLGDRTYNNRLAELNLPSLKYQRHRGDMIMIYQLLHHNLNVANVLQKLKQISSF